MFAGAVLVVVVLWPLALAAVIVLAVMRRWRLLAIYGSAFAVVTFALWILAQA